MMTSFDLPASGLRFIAWEARLRRAWLLARPLGVAAVGFGVAFCYWCLAMQPAEEFIRQGFDGDPNGVRGFLMLIAAGFFVLGWNAAQRARRWFFETAVRRPWRWLLTAVWLVGIYCALVAVYSPDHRPHWLYRPAPISSGSPADTITA